MKARMPAGFGRPDMNALMRQAQKMQDDMKAKQAELEAAEYTGSASGEMVTVRMNGKHEILGITIKPEAVDVSSSACLGARAFLPRCALTATPVLCARAPCCWACCSRWVSWCCAACGAWAVPTRICWCAW